MVFLSVVCKLGSAETGDGSKNLGRPISRTVRATSERKLGKRKPNKTKKQNNQNGKKNKNKPTRTSINKRRTKKKMKSQKTKGKGGKNNKNRNKKQNRRRKLQKKKKKKNRKNSRTLKQNNKKKNKKNRKPEVVKQKAKERRIKERQRKAQKARNSSSTGCPDLACINNAGTALKLEKDQISNFIKQKSRVENYMKTVSGKLGKKGQFEADAASLKSALGGNLDNATCGGSAQRTVSAAAKVGIKHSLQMILH